MEFRFQIIDANGWAADCVLAFAFEENTPESLAPALWEKAPWLAIAPGLRDFKGAGKEHLLVYGHPDLPLSRVLLIGLGKEEKASVQSFRLALASAVAFTRERGFATLGVSTEHLRSIAERLGVTLNELAKEVAVASTLALYRCEDYKGKTRNSKLCDPRWFAFMSNTAPVDESFITAVRNGEAEAAGVVVARNLVNGPANIITPSVLAEAATALAEEHKFSCKIMTEKEIIEAGMGAFASVACGAREEARFIILEYRPEESNNSRPFVVVGKGVTFDTGGISLKPAAKMHEMKGDMAGAAAVLGFFEAIGKTPDKSVFPHVVGLIPTTENMPGGEATRPGDIVTTLSGQTVEVLNTDAEGRLILCDALTYAQQNWKPAALLDIATLTGACVVALGDDCSGLFTDNSKLRRSVMDAAEKLGELFWPLPMFKEYEKNIKSDVADIANVGPREGGAIHAALFLKKFIEEETVWAHLDIAGPGYVVKPTALHPVAGGTGEGVRLFCELARNIKVHGPF